MCSGISIGMALYLKIYFFSCIGTGILLTIPISFFMLVATQIQYGYAHNGYCDVYILGCIELICAIKLLLWINKPRLISPLTIRPFTLKNMSYMLSRYKLPIIITEMKNSDRIFPRFTPNPKGHCLLPTAKNPMGTWGPHVG